MPHDYLSVLSVQVELMWQKFGAGIWEALSKRYTDIDMNEVCDIVLKHLLVMIAILLENY